MRTHSLFFKLNLLFAVALIATLAAGISIALNMIKKEQTELLIKSRLLAREYRHRETVPLDLVRELGLRLVGSNPDIERYTTLHPKGHIRVARIIRHDGYLYLKVHNRHSDLLLRQEQSLYAKLIVPMMVLAGMVLLLVLMYLMLRRSLMPLHTLHSDILRYGDGIEIPRRTSLEGHDEVSEVSNAFYASVEKIQRLGRSRELFVRNIFHELNTPVTKGKILAELVDDPKSKDMLESIFGRLASLLSELAQVEMITSQDIELHIQPIRIIELIDQARDLLYMDADIDTNITDETIMADFAMMSIVFKNLIDNAGKYGSDLYIRYDDTGISFITTGNPLKHPLAYYLEPFASDDRSTKDGFGLGLYIVDEILKKHNLKLLYHYHDGKNIFAIADKTR